MIESAVALVVRALDDHLRRELGTSESKVVISNLVDLDGSVPTHIRDKLVAFVVNVTMDPGPETVPAATHADDRVVAGVPIYLNLSLMLASYASNHAEALELLSKVVTFFRTRPMLDHTNTPDLDPRIERLVLEIENLGLGDLSSLWGMLGGRHVPSVLYRLRVVALDADSISGRVPAVERP